MKIIHCADLHIDSRMKTNLNSLQASERKKEILLSFERMIRYAKDVGVRAIIIAGDMFDTKSIAFTPTLGDVNGCARKENCC